MFDRVDKNRGQRKTIPRPTRKEFRAIRDLVGLLVGDVGAPLGNVAWSSDAEGVENDLESSKRGRRPRITDPGGFGVAASLRPQDEIMQEGSKSELRGRATTEEKQRDIIMAPIKNVPSLPPDLSFPPGGSAVPKSGKMTAEVGPGRTRLI